VIRLLLCRVIGHAWESRNGYSAVRGNPDWYSWGQRLSTDNQRRCKRCGRRENWDYSTMSFARVSSYGDDQYWCTETHRWKNFGKDAE